VRPALAGFLALALLAGCLAQLPAPGLCVERGSIAECGRVTGVVMAVEGSGPASVDQFTLRTPDGRVLTMAVERLDVSGGGKPAAHLREHQLDGQPIEVEYKVEGGRHVALRYTDAD
jgi:hypothetical protein